MSVTYSARVALDILFQQVITSGNLVSGPLEGHFRELFDITPAAGTMVCYAKSETAIGATTTVYDIIGSLSAVDGSATLSMARVYLIAIKNRGTSATQYLTIGPDATNGFGAISANTGFWAAALGSGGGTVVAADGYSWAVHYNKTGIAAVAATSDEVSVVTTGTGNAWDILFIGATA